MSYTNFVKAMELAPKCKFYMTAGGKSEEKIVMSEKKLGISFSRQCREFYKSMAICPFLAMKYMELIQRMIQEY